MSGGEACIRKGMERTRLRKPALSQSESACPLDPAFLTPATNGSPPERDQPIPKHSQTLEVSWYRVVVEVALHDRLEPSSGLGHGIMHTLAELHAGSKAEGESDQGTGRRVGVGTLLDPAS